VAGDDAQIPDAAALHEIAHGEPLRMVAHHERLADEHTGTLAHLEKLPRLVGRERDRLLAEHVLPRFRGADRPRHVQVIRERIVDGLDVGIGEELLVRTIRPLDAELPCRTLRLAQLARSDRDDAASRAALHRGCDLLHGNVRRAENPPADACVVRGYHRWCTSGRIDRS